MLTKKTKSGLVILAVDVDDIILSGSDDTSILATKTYLHNTLAFVTWGVVDTFVGSSLLIRTGSSL